MGWFFFFLISQNTESINSFFSPSFELLFIRYLIAGNMIRYILLIKIKLVIDISILKL